MILDFWATVMKEDQALFELINGQWTSPWLSNFMPWMRTSEHWIPLYICLLGFVFYHWRWKAWKWLVTVALTITMTDQVSSFIFKPWIHRLRPCADPAMLGHVKLLLGACPSNFSFTSSHAANHFGLAIFVFITLAPLLKKYRYLFFLWAGIISYAQIYVGVHYPIDILGGTIIGITFGYLFAKIYLKWSNNGMQ